MYLVYYYSHNNLRIQFRQFYSCWIATTPRIRDRAAIPAAMISFAFDIPVTRYSLLRYSSLRKEKLSTFPLAIGCPLGLGSRELVNVRSRLIHDRDFHWRSRIRLRLSPLAAPVCALYAFSLGHENSRVPRHSRRTVLTTLDSPFRSWRGTRFATLSAAPRYRSLSPASRSFAISRAKSIARPDTTCFLTFRHAFRDETFLACRASV